MSNYDESYKKICDLDLDLRVEKHSAELLKFLNSWGCRQFAKDDHDQASIGLENWYVENKSRLPVQNLQLLKISNKDIEVFADLFNSLKSVNASVNSNGHKNTVGPVGAAKALFALRKHIFAPWDNAIMKKVGYSGTGQEYVRYLKDIKGQLSNLRTECRQLKININDLPAILDRKHVSLVKLVDEYLYLKYTRDMDIEHILKLAQNRKY